jgi:hypothetical protein
MECAEMLLDLDKRVIELKELTWRLAEIGLAHEKTAYLLENDPTKANLDTLANLEESTRALTTMARTQRQKGST